MRFRYGSPLRSHTEVKLAVYLDKSRCVNHFCNSKCSLVTTLHCTQIPPPSSENSQLCSVPLRSTPRGEFSRGYGTSHNSDVIRNFLFALSSVLTQTFPMMSRFFHQRKKLTITTFSTSSEKLRATSGMFNVGTRK